MMSRDNLRPGVIFQHFKGKLYQIITIAKHTETREDLVIYQALYGDYRTFARPYTMFIEEVDRNKYPDAEQTYRFEVWQQPITPVTPSSESENTEKLVSTEKLVHTENKNTDENEIAKTDSSDRTMEHTQKLLEFLDAKTCQEKWTILEEMEKENNLNEHNLNSIIVSLDLIITEDNFNERLDGVKDYLRTRIRFESSRLR